MFETTNARRVTVIVDATLESQLLDKIVELGARGYNTIKCGGRGTHAITGDPVATGELVRIEVIASIEIGNSILDYIHTVQFRQFGRYALTAYADTVEVDRRDRSLFGH